MVVGCEIDEASCRDAKARFETSPVTLLNADFLELAPTAIRPVDAVLANPPFTRNHRLPALTRQRLRERMEFREIVEGAPGLWVYFMLASLQFLKRGGRFAFIAPRTIEFADYATPVLGALKARFQNVTLLSVEGSVDWEGAAEERASLVLAAGFGMGPRRIFEFSVCRSRPAKQMLHLVQRRDVRYCRQLSSVILPTSRLGS